MKPITSTALRPELLKFSRTTLTSRCACALKRGEDCESTAVCVERVVQDMNILTSVVAGAINRAVKDSEEGKGEEKNVDFEILKEWADFYENELLPQTRELLKVTAAKLDRYSIFIPTRISGGVSKEVIDKVRAGGSMPAVEPAEEEKEAEVVEDKEEEVAEEEKEEEGGEEVSSSDVVEEDSKDDDNDSTEGDVEDEYEEYEQYEDEDY